MKTRNKLMIIAALCCAAFVLGACSYEGGSSGQGSIRINFENSNARYGVTNNDKEAMSYTITLTSPGKKDIIIPPEEITIPTTTLTVQEGIWNITVQANAEEGKRVIEGKGERKDVEVKPGESVDAAITMAIIGTRVSSWKELDEDFTELNKGIGSKLQDLEYIEIAGNLTADSGLDLTTTKTITLQAKKDVRITRGTDQKIKPVFTLTNCTLILDGTQGGGIEINGNKNNITGTSSSRALINVETNSTLTMLDGVTITNNVSSSTGEGGYGGGVYVKNATFNMNGGTISKNRASSNGGGVYIDSGTFTKTNGIIYGYTQGVDNSNVTGSGSTVTDAGNAVYFKTGTMSINDDLTGPWPTE